MECKQPPPDHLGTHKSSHPTSSSSQKCSQSLTHLAQSDVKPKKSRKESCLKSAHSEDGEVEMMACTHGGVGQDKVQMANHQLPTVLKVEEHSVILEEQITSFAKAMGPRNAHKRAKDLFTTLSDSDSSNMELEDFNWSNSSEELDDELVDDLPAGTGMLKKPKVSDSAPLGLQKGKEQSRSVSRQWSEKDSVKDDDPETCSG